MNPLKYSTFAPIALFLFRRPEHTRKMLDSLIANPEFLVSPLFIFCDAAKNESDQRAVQETRVVASTLNHPNVTLVFQENNLGLAKSIRNGVSTLCKQFGRVIVVEDDLLVSSKFLNFMNAALTHYMNEPKVMQISGYMFPLEMNSNTNAVLLPITSTWGWATWERAWGGMCTDTLITSNLIKDSISRHDFDLQGSYPYTRRLHQQLAGKSDSWGILWYLHVFLSKGLVLYPPSTLVVNIGHDGTGTHCRDEERVSSPYNAPYVGDITFPISSEMGALTFSDVKKHLRLKNSYFIRLYINFKSKFRGYIKKLVGRNE